jgi:hypothetical protein
VIFLTLVGLGVIGVALLLFGVGLCRMSAISDRDMERMRRAKGWKL